MTDTPRTDARTDGKYLTPDGAYLATVALARELERELAALRARVLELEEALRGEILGIPTDVNTVRWAKRCHELEASSIVLRSRVLQLEALADKWRDDVRTYPDTSEGLHAKAAVCLCIRELEWRAPASGKETP